MQRILFAVILAVTCVTGAAAGALEDADFASLRGDHAREAKLLRPLAEQGDAQAQNTLGKLHYEGKGVSQNYGEAVKWYRKAAKQGNEEAQFNLTGMYASGQGIPQDAQEAAMWYRQGAEEGDAEAQARLGLIYSQGLGVPQDLVRAHMWYHIATAALAGDVGKLSMNSRDRLASRMTAVQIGKAQELARHCQRSQFRECD